ncbi:septin-1-like [Rhopilema esculentum]|uniref:septin-1-like n=1 Tax=Rhopilema esculentum TaxID=499914 RepID=UPI0031DBE017|eukprot:gene15060-6225_t
MSSYVGFANLPNQVHRKTVKRGFEFTLMVVGESGLGKSTLVNSLFLTDLYAGRAVPSASERVKSTLNIETSACEIEERGVKLKLTVVDTPGFGDGINNSECFEPILEYVDLQFENYLRDESGLNRRNIADTRVHCCFYFVSPSGHGLKPIDVKFMKMLHEKVNIVPVIGKADSLTKTEIGKLKKKVMEEMQKHGIRLYDFPDCEQDEDEDFRNLTKQLKATMPFAVVGSNAVLDVKGKKVRGRAYPWGVVEVENPEHSDFVKLRTMLITYMQDLKEVTQDVHYENYRAQKLTKPGQEVAKKEPRVNADDKDALLKEKEAELKRMQDMIAKMQAQMKSQQQ